MTLHIDSSALLVPLREHVRSERSGDLHAVLHVVAARLDTLPSVRDERSSHLAAAQMTIMERVGRDNIAHDDDPVLRELWEALLAK